MANDPHSLWAMRSSFLRGRALGSICGALIPGPEFIGGGREVIVPHAGLVLAIPGLWIDLTPGKV